MLGVSTLKYEYTPKGKKKIMKMIKITSKILPELS
jgi:hypothetical protein